MPRPWPPKSADISKSAVIEAEPPLEKQRTEYENLDIIGLVRSMGVTPEELAAIMQAARQNPAAPATTEKEEPDYAETEND